MRLNIHQLLSFWFSATLLVMMAACDSPDADKSTAHPDNSSTKQQSASQFPANFPADFPLPSNFTITEGQFTKGDAMTQANFLVRGTSSMGVSELATFYHTRLPEAGYTVQGQPPPPGRTNALVSFHGKEFRDCSVQLSSAGAKTNILISLPLRD